MATRLSPDERLAHERVAPAQARPAMMRATLFLEVRSPWPLSVRQALGAPWIPRLRSQTAPVFAAGSRSLASCALAGLFAQA